MQKMIKVIVWLVDSLDTSITIQGKG